MSRSFESQINYLMKKPTFKFEKIKNYLNDLFQTNVHAKRVNSIANAVQGVITSTSLALSMIGQGLAASQGKITKHCKKQVDRLLSNAKFDVWGYFSYWVPEQIGNRKEVVIAMDWTEFDLDDQSTLALNLVTNHGRATPLLWKTFVKSDFKGKKNGYEEEVLRHLKILLPKDVKVTILADRGFGYVYMYNILKELGFNYVIRFKGNIKVYDKDGNVKDAKDWVGKNGRAKRLDNAKVTATNREPIEIVICVQDKAMKDSWCLATDRCDLKTNEIKNYYGKRWSIETSFRDSKNLRFGMGMYEINISTPERRDRLLFISAIAVFMLTVLGAASEALGFDRYLKSNTSKKRTHSLYRQGCMWYELIPNMDGEKLKLLIEKFHELLLESKATKEIFSFV